MRDRKGIIVMEEVLEQRGEGDAQVGDDCAAAAAAACSSTRFHSLSEGLERNCWLYISWL